MRAVFNSLMAALVVMALFWGNCFSCPQVLLAAQSHRCCPHGKSDPKECKTQGLRSFVKAEKAVNQVPAGAPPAAMPPAMTSAPTAAPFVRLASAAYTPPDILPLRI